jgi:hypothetical protein
MKARVRQLVQSGMPMDQVRETVRKELKSSVAYDGQAMLQEVRDLARFAPRADYDVNVHLAPDEIVADPDYQSAIRQTATGSTVMIPANKYFKPLPAVVLPPVDSYPYTMHSQTEMGVLSNPPPSAGNLLTLEDYDYKRGYPYPLDLIETDMEKQGLMDYQYERGNPYPPDLLWAEIERAGEDVGAQGMNSWLDEELMAKYSTNGVKGLGAIETLFLL